VDAYLPQLNRSKTSIRQSLLEQAPGDWPLLIPWISFRQSFPATQGNSYANLINNYYDQLEVYLCSLSTRWQISCTVERKNKQEYTTKDQDLADDLQSILLPAFSLLQPPIRIASLAT
jgi:hypothetical protein